MGKVGKWEKWENVKSSEFIWRRREGRLMGGWLAYLQDSAENRRGRSLQCEICAAYIEINLLSRLPPSNSSFGIQTVRPSIVLDVSLVSSYSDGGLLYVRRPLFEISSISANIFSFSF